MKPRKILMIKSHSMGVGDVLRSSAAWRVLKNRWPDVELHLLFLSKHPGYPTENLIQSHHLLSSATFMTLRHGSPDRRDAKRVSMSHLARQIQDLCHQINPDLIIDFEASGLRTSLLTLLAARTCQAQTVGIAQFPGRRFFYDLAAPSVSAYAKSHELTLPMDYTNRDFVALAALGLQREGTAIELKISLQGQQYLDSLQVRLPQGRPIMGLNIGCGTPDAMVKRPNLRDLAQSIGALLLQHPHTVLLSGADFEKPVNQEFIAAYNDIWGNASHLIDLAGETSLSGLTGLIEACDVFVSTDSGPYHMAVALRKPTIVWFTYAELTSYHDHPWCRRLVQPSSDQFQAAFMELMKSK